MFWGSEVVPKWLTLYRSSCKVFQEGIDVDLVVSSLDVTRNSRCVVPREDVVRAGTFEMFAVMVASAVLTPSLSDTAGKSVCNATGKEVTNMREILASVMSYVYEFQGLL